MSSSKKFTCKGTLRQASGFIDWRYSQSCWYFRPSIVNCCLSNLLSGSTLPPPLFLVWISIHTVYANTVCKGRVGLGLWASDICRKVPLRANFLDDYFCVAFFESYLSTSHTKELEGGGGGRMLVFLINMENMPDSSVLFPHHAPCALGNRQF